MNVVIQLPKDDVDDDEDDEDNARGDNELDYADD